jgi:hypothetical protein
VLTRALAVFAAACGIAAAAAPSCGLVPGWTQKGEARTYVADTLFEYMDGNSEGYLLYGFVKMQGVTCEKAGATFVVDLSEFVDDDAAFGMFSATHDPKQPQTKIGAAGQIVPRKAIFVKGKFYLEIAAEPEGDHSAALREFTTAIEKTLDGSSSLPASLSLFSADKRQSLRPVPESVLGIRLLKRGYFAQYEYGKAFLVTEDSPQAASALMQKLRARFGETSDAKVADEAFQAADRYLGKLCMFRKGRTIGGWANVADGSDAMQLATLLAGKLP